MNDMSYLLSLRGKVLASKRYYHKRGIDTNWHAELMWCIDRVLLRGWNYIIAEFPEMSEKHVLLIGEIIENLKKYLVGDRTVHEAYKRCTRTAKALYTNGREEIACW